MKLKESGILPGRRPNPQNTFHKFKCIAEVGMR
jgi:hypothetical protein